MPFEWNFEIAATNLKRKLTLPEPQKPWVGVSIDTRTLKTGDVFFALKGKKQDGHDFFRDAFQKGASGAIIREEFFKENRERFFLEKALFHNLIAVPSPEEALLRLAGFYRGYFSATAVAITGSVGKTSTKEFLRFLLSQKHPVLASSAGWNNCLGLPLTLFQLRPEHVFCIAELGANHKGEIRMLSRLLKPQIGVITGVTPAHLEGFGPLSAVYDAKLELADTLTGSKGTLILPDWDPELIQRAKKRKLPILYFGRDRGSDFWFSEVKAEEGWVEFEVNGRWQFRFPGYAAFQAENALAAIAAAFACGISLRALPSVWKGVEFPKGRFEILHPREGIIFIHDCYNANPYSFEKALDSFEEFERTGRKILVLGDMLELGSESGNYHRKLGEWIKEKNVHVLLTFGHWIQETAAVCERSGNPPLTLHFEDKGMLAHFLDHFLKFGDQVFFKASRAIQLEEVIRTLSSTSVSKSAIR